MLKMKEYKKLTQGKTNKLQNIKDSILGVKIIYSAV